jgi:hypothetical protein
MVWFLSFPALPTLPPLEITPSPHGIRIHLTTLPHHLNDPRLYAPIRIIACVFNVWYLI